MAGIDESIDTWLRYIWGFFVQWSLISWHYATDTWDRGCEWGVKTLRAVEHAHKENVWVFLDRDAMPLLRKEDELTDHYDNKLVFYPNSSTFLLHNRLTENRFHSFDCVDVSLRKISNNKIENITEFFMNIKWKSGANPTLAECIKIYGILHNTPFTNIGIADYCLIVIDSNGDEHQIQLGSDLAHIRFSGWT
jgi:hypothetical protein